jgi:hypothetical protein
MIGNSYIFAWFNPLNADLNIICHLLALLEAHPIFHVSRIRVNYTRAVRKVSGHFEYLENWSCGLDVTWQPVRRYLTALS